MLAYIYLHRGGEALGTLSELSQNFDSAGPGSFEFLALCNDMLYYSLGRSVDMLAALGELGELN